MKPLRFVLLVLLPILLASCATLTRQDRATLQQHGVAPSVYNRMMLGEELSLADIIELSQHGVPPKLIVNYLDSTGVVYRLQRRDVVRLRNAGVSESVISYLLSTFRGYGGGYYTGYDGPFYGGYRPYGPYPYGPGYYPGYYGYYGPEFIVGGRFGRGGEWREGHERREGHEGHHGH